MWAVIAIGMVCAFVACGGEDLGWKESRDDLPSEPAPTAADAPTSTITPPRPIPHELGSSRLEDALREGNVPASFETHGEAAPEPQLSVRQVVERIASVSGPGLAVHSVDRLVWIDGEALPVLHPGITPRPGGYLWIAFVSGFFPIRGPVGSEPQVGRKGFVLVRDNTGLVLGRGVWASPSQGNNLDDPEIRKSFPGLFPESREEAAEGSQ